MSEFPWTKSGILIAQIVGVIVAVTTVFGITLDAQWLTETITAIFAGIGALVGVYTFIKRLWSPSPNLTAAATQKEANLVAEGVIPRALASNVVATGAVPPQKE